MNEADATSAEFFERKYLAHTDPWEFATSDYELRRYGEIIRSLSDRRYQGGFEPGCSIGELTVRLAPLCHRLTVCEISPTAAARARQRAHNHPNVTVVCRSMADFLPMRAIDLIVLSEVGYYFEPQELLSLANRLTGVLDAGGVLLASHWLGISEDHRMSGDAVHDVLQSIPGLVHIEGNRYDKFRIDKWNKK